MTHEQISIYIKHTSEVNGFQLPITGIIFKPEGDQHHPIKHIIVPCEDTPVLQGRDGKITQRRIDLNEKTGSGSIQIGPDTFLVAETHQALERDTETQQVKERRASLASPSHRSNRIRNISIPKKLTQRR